MELYERLADFIKEFYYTELNEQSMEDMPALVIDFSKLDMFDPLISDQLIENPEFVIENFEKAVQEIDIPTEKEVKIRIKNLPESAAVRIRNLRAKHIGKFLKIDAVIKSSSEVKPQIKKVVFECPDCGNEIKVEQKGSIIKKPSICDCGRRGDFEMKSKEMFDTRWLKCAEPFEVTTGEQPGEVKIFLKEDLTTPKMQKKTDPGNRITVTGILKELPKKIKGRMSTKMDVYIDANYFESSQIEFDEIIISPEDEKILKELSKDEKIFDKLKDSIAPAIYGYDEIKLALVFQLFGGVPHTLPDGTRIRDNIHILLTGDPGIGKTQILKMVSTIVPRGKYASGKGVSGAGLTATVVKDEKMGGWVLEAGALVLANKSIIGIDEFDKMTKDDQIAMHEAMSAGTISIAKASIFATLPARTSVLAGANPKFGRFDPFRSVPEQIEIPETLLSRFDLKFALKDEPDKVRDEILAKHIIDARINPDTVKPALDPLLLRKYIAYARKIDKIKLTQEAAERLKNFYIEMRNLYSGEETKTIAITLRQYEALIRLSEACAKIRLDTEVRVDDAEKAIKIMKYSLSQLGTDPETGRIDVDMIESGITTSQRSKIRIVLEMIEELQNELGGDVPMSDVQTEAENRGIAKIDDILDRLINEGSIFQPRSGFVRKV